MILSFRDLDVYINSYQLSLEIHRLVKQLPTFEVFELGSQMRRASKSCPANIAEGWAKRRFEKEFKKHLDISIGSANEMEVHLSFAKDLEYVNAKECNQLITAYQHLGGKLVSLRNTWKTF